MIKIITGHSSYGGSTTAFINLTNLFNKNGIECKLYGPHDWHLNKCNSGMLNDCVVSPDDIFIVHYISLQTRLSCKKMILSVHEYTKIFDTKNLNLNIFDTFHCVSEKVRVEQNLPEDSKIITNVTDDLIPNKKTISKSAGIIGTIHPIKNVHISIQRALNDGMREINIFGNIGDQSYYDKKILPYLKAYPNKIKVRGYVEDKQKIYDCVTDVYHSSDFETWGYIKAECKLTNTKYHGNNKTDGVVYMSNEEILTEWDKII